MAETVIEESIRDTNTYYSSTVEGDKNDKKSFQIVNGLDNSVTVTVEISNNADDGWSDAVEVVNTSVAASTNDTITVSKPWDKLRLTVSAGTSPTAGTFVGKLHTR